MKKKRKKQTLGISMTADFARGVSMLLSKTHMNLNKTPHKDNVKS